MADLCPRARTGRDSDRLSNSVDESRTFTSNVRGIATLVRRRVLRQRDQLVGREESARQIDQAGAYANCAIAHRRIDERAHLPHFSVGRVTRRLAHHSLAHRARPDIRAEVDGCSVLLEESEVLAQRSPRVSRIRLLAQREVGPRGMDLTGYLAGDALRE